MFCDILCPKALYGCVVLPMAANVPRKRSLQSTLDAFLKPNPVVTDDGSDAIVQLTGSPTQRKSGSLRIWCLRRSRWLPLRQEERLPPSQKESQPPNGLVWLCKRALKRLPNQPRAPLPPPLRPVQHTPCLSCKPSMCNNSKCVVLVPRKSLHTCSLCFRQWRVPQFALRYPCNPPPPPGDRHLVTVSPPHPGDRRALPRDFARGAGGSPLLRATNHAPSTGMGSLPEANMTNCACMSPRHAFEEKCCEEVNTPGS